MDRTKFPGHFWRCTAAYQTSVAIICSQLFILVAHLVHIRKKINVSIIKRIITPHYNDYELTKGHPKYKHGRKTTPKIASCSRFSRTFDEIPVYSWPGILIIKLRYFPGSTNPVYHHHDDGTDPALTRLSTTMLQFGTDGDL